MARNSKEPKIPLKKPDRSPPDPSHQTLLDIAEQRGLLKDSIASSQNTSDADITVPVGRWQESLLWSFSMATGLFTLDVLVANQYAIQVDWWELALRTTQAFPSISPLPLFS